MLFNFGAVTFNKIQGNSQSKPLHWMFYGTSKMWSLALDLLVSHKEYIACIFYHKLAREMSL